MAKSKSIVNDTEAGKANLAANLALEGAATDAPEGEKRGPGRPKSENLTIASFKAIVKAHMSGEADLPDNVHFKAGHMVEGSTRWEPGEYSTGAIWTTSEGGKVATVVTLTCKQGGKPTQTVGQSVNVAQYL